MIELIEKEGHNKPKECDYKDSAIQCTDRHDYDNSEQNDEDRAEDDNDEEEEDKDD